MIIMIIGNNTNCYDHYYQQQYRLLLYATKMYTPPPINVCSVYLKQCIQYSKQLVYMYKSQPWKSIAMMSLVAGEPQSFCFYHVCFLIINYSFLVYQYCHHNFGVFVFLFMLLVCLLLGSRSPRGQAGHGRKPAACKRGEGYC